MTAIDILQQSIVEGNIIKLPPGQLDRNLYDKVAQKLHGIGGRWKGGKVKGFVFKEDPSGLLSQIQGGANINLKKQYQFITTQPDLADKVVRLAEVYHDDRVLEPSAGGGAIIKAIHKIHPELVVDYCELMHQNLVELQQIPNTHKVAEDFLVYQPGAIYDVIIANPPFSKNQDIDHIYHMYKMLRPGGRIVSIASVHWDMFDDKPKEKQFKLWLTSKRATIEYLPAGTFKKSGTNFPSCIITINKPVV